MSLKHKVRRWFWRIGLGLSMLNRAQRGAFPPYEPQLTKMISHLFDGDEDVSIVLIGANDGVSFDWLYDYLLARKHRICGVAVEPIGDYFRELKENFRVFDRVKLVQAAVGTKSGQVEMYKINREAHDTYPSWKGVASLCPKHHLKTKAPSNMVESESVRMLTAHQLLTEANICRVDYLQIDAEGYDAIILSAWPFAAVKPRLIRFEHLGISSRAIKVTCDKLNEEGYKNFVDGNDIIAVLQ